MAHSDNLFTLRKIIQASSKDIRAVCRYSNSGFVAGSRDNTSKLYLCLQSNEFCESQIFRGPTHYVSSLTSITVGDEILIYAGSNDSCIYCYDMIESHPRSILVGHSGTVCALNADTTNSLISSGSWDQTAIIWKDHSVYKTLKGHEAAIWTVITLGNLILTGSADKTIKRWNESSLCVQTYKGHTDCVRSLAIVDKNSFLSSSNDSTIRHWNIDGTTIATFDGHENFVYSISILRSLNGELHFISSSEDRTVRVWKNSASNVQSIRLPCTTLWSVAALDEDNFVVGASDGRVYAFTRDPSKIASEAEIKQLEEEARKTSLPLAELGGINVDQLPGPQSLSIPGKKEGATKLIKENGKIYAYQWDSFKQQWNKVGDVVGQADRDKDPSSKVLYEGKEYDYVFDVDIQDGVPPLKLPYNLSENPYMTAQQFIYKYELSQSYLDQIANFIIKNTGGKAGTRSDGTDPLYQTEYCDPYTGHSRYIPK